VIGLVLAAQRQFEVNDMIKMLRQVLSSQKEGLEDCKDVC
jgi:hypothetical protein